MSGGQFSGVDTRVEDRYDSLHTNFNQTTLTGQHTLSDKWNIDEMIGFSQSRFANPVQTTLGWDRTSTKTSSTIHRGTCRTTTTTRDGRFSWVRGTSIDSR